jgi:hypothetical protein
MRGPTAAAGVAAVALALPCLLPGAVSAGETPHSGVSATAAAHAITLRARVGRGPWRRALSIRLVKTTLIEFSVCALWDKPAAASFSCRSPRGARLPAGTSLRLEQHPIARALKRADSPGWGMLATSGEAALGAALSNTVSGDRLGTVRYRVTLRDGASKILVRSNVFVVRWHG